jgi:hypothetical protein
MPLSASGGDFSDAFRVWFDQLEGLSLSIARIRCALVLCWRRLGTHRAGGVPLTLLIAADALNGLRTVDLLNGLGPQQLVSSNDGDHDHPTVLTDRTLSLDCSLLFRAKL